MAIYLKANELKAGIDYRITEGGEWISIKQVFVNGNHTVINTYDGAQRSLPSNETVEVRL